MSGMEVYIPQRQPLLNAWLIYNTKYLSQKKGKYDVPDMKTDMYAGVVDAFLWSSLSASHVWRVKTREDLGDVSYHSGV